MPEYPNRATATVTAKSWEESHVVEAESPHAIARATFTTTFRGDIEGESTCALLLSYTAGDPEKPQTLEGPYVGYEQVTGTLAGRAGTFVLAARGEHTGGVARTDIVVVPGSATGELAGLVGAGSYAADAMEYSLTLDYDFE